MVRGPSRIALVVGVLLAVGAAACGPATREYREDFSDPERDPWTQERRETAVLEYADGRYRITVLRGGERELSSRELPEPVDALRIEVDLAEERGTGEETLYGVACGAGETTRYFVSVNRRGPFAIEKATGGSGVERLARSRVTRGFGGQGSAVRLGAECRVDGEDVAITLEVGQRRITGERDDGAGVEGFDRVSLFVLTPNPGTQVEFDNLVVREL